MSAETGTRYSARFAFMTRPLRSSHSLRSSSAMPSPPTMPPMHWLLAILGLTIRPAA
jgi:hypothetical protein